MSNIQATLPTGVSQAGGETLTPGLWDNLRQQSQHPNLGIEMGQPHLLRVGNEAIQGHTAKDVENEEMEMLHHQIIAHAATVPYTQDTTTTEGSRKVVSAGTIVNYFGIIKNLMRCKFPNHPEWPQSPSDNPIWYKELVANFKKEYERSARNWSEDDYHRGSNKIRAFTGTLMRWTLIQMICMQWLDGTEVIQLAKVYSQPAVKWEGI